MKGEGQIFLRITGDDTDGRGLTRVAETLAPQRCHADAEDLTGAEVAVSGFGHSQEFIKGFHCILMLRPEA
jgi:hypothetical protein